MVAEPAASPAEAAGLVRTLIEGDAGVFAESGAGSSLEFDIKFRRLRRDGDGNAGSLGILELTRYRNGGSQWLLFSRRN